MRGWIPLALVAALTVSAAPPATAATRTAAREELRTARERFAAGRQAFQNGDYERAITEFQAADQAKPSAMLDYNIALALERLGRPEQAAAAFQRYLERDPQSPRRDEVLGRIRELQQRAANAPAAPASEPPAPDHSPATAPQPAPPPDPAPAPLPPWLDDAPPPPPAPPPLPPPPREPVRRLFGVGGRIGLATSGALGRGDAAYPRPHSPGAMLELFFRFSLPAAHLHAEVALAVRGYQVGQDQGSIDVAMLRARAGYFFPVRSWLELGGSAGLDWVTVAFKTAAPTGNVSGRVFGLSLEGTARMVLGERHELLVTPVAFQLLPGMSVAAAQQATAHLEGADRGSVSYQFLVGYALRF